MAAPSLAPVPVVASEPQASFTVSELKECRFHQGPYDPKKSDAHNKERFCSDVCEQLHRLLAN